MTLKKYRPETYWNKVAEKINIREDLKIIAGDDEPYYRYKRKMFLKLFDTICVKDKRILEVGSGPGGNLDFLTNKGCAEIVGVDVSEKMVHLSKSILKNKNIQIQKIDGFSLPFDNNYFDIVFTSTVLQHNTDETQLKQLIKSICRVSKSEVIIFERIEKHITGHETNMGRPVKYYSDLFMENAFALIKTEFLPIQASYYSCGAIRKIFNRPDKEEGEPMSKISKILQSIVLPITSTLDRVIPIKRDLGMLFFKKNIT